MENKIVNIAITASLRPKISTFPCMSETFSEYPKALAARTDVDKFIYTCHCNGKENAVKIERSQ
jgi:hypothetical protein